MAPAIKVSLTAKFLKSVSGSIPILRKLNNKRIALEFQKVGAP